MPVFCVDILTFSLCLIRDFSRANVNVVSSLCYGNVVLRNTLKYSVNHMCYLLQY